MSEKYGEILLLAAAVAAQTAAPTFILEMERDRLAYDGRRNNFGRNT